MRKSFILVMFTTVISFSALNAQEVVSTQGASYTSTEGKINFTVGEVLIETSNELTQGFHQTNLIVSKVEDYDINLNISVFPNPVMDKITIEIPNFQDKYTVEIIDLSGNVITKKPILSLQNTLDVSALSPGLYFLNLRNVEQKIVKTFKIQKIK